MSLADRGFVVWSPNNKPCSALDADLLHSEDENTLHRTTSGSSTQVPDDLDMKLERTVSETSTIVREEGGHSSCDECLDGPSLTVDGKAVDLEAGAPMFFAHDKLCADSYERKRLAKEYARALRADRQKDAAAQVVADEVCSLDAAGVVRGEKMMAPPLSGDRDGRAARLKLYHRKLHARRGSAERCWPPLCMDGHGKTLMYLDLKGKSSRRARLRQEQARRASGAQDVLSRAAATIDESEPNFAQTSASFFTSHAMSASAFTGTSRRAARRGSLAK